MNKLKKTFDNDNHSQVKNTYATVVVLDFFGCLYSNRLQEAVLIVTGKRFVALLNDSRHLVNVKRKVYKGTNIIFTETPSSQARYIKLLQKILFWNWEGSLGLLAGKTFKKTWNIWQFIGHLVEKLFQALKFDTAENLCNSLTWELIV